MSDKKMKYPIGELPQSASSGSQTVDELAEKKRNQKKSLIRIGAMCVLIAVTIIFGSLSWFTQNRETSVSGMRTKTSALPFDIATKGARVRNSTVMNAQKSEYTEGTSGTYSDVNGSEGTYYVGDSLLLRFDPTRQDDPKTDADESIPPDISPGSRGELSLYVIPKSESAMNVKVSLNVISFAEIDDMNKGNGEKKIIEIKDAEDFEKQAEAVGNEEASKAANEYVAAANYLKGHILFFGGIGDTTNENENDRYYYKEPYTTRTLMQEIQADNKGKAVPVPIYWTWTHTLGQILLPNNTSGQRSGYPVVSDTNTTGKDALKNYLIDNRSNIFFNNSDNTISNINDVADAQSFNIDAFKNLSSGYNEADHIIGTKIAYFMIEVTVEPAA